MKKVFVLFFIVAMALASLWIFIKVVPEMFARTGSGNDVVKPIKKLNEPNDAVNAE